MRQSVWEAPPELSQDEIKRLPGAELLNGSAPTEVRASHLLVKHKGSRRPASWKEVRCCSVNILCAIAHLNIGCH